MTNVNVNKTGKRSNNATVFIVNECVGRTLCTITYAFCISRQSQLSQLVHSAHRPMTFFTHMHLGLRSMTWVKLSKHYIIHQQQGNGFKLLFKLKLSQHLHLVEAWSQKHSTMLSCSAVCLLYFEHVFIKHNYRFITLNHKIIFNIGLSEYK